MQKLTSRNDEIQKLAGIGKATFPRLFLLHMCLCPTVAMEMCACQGEVSSVMQELDQRKQEVSQLQAHLQEAERIIVSLGASRVRVRSRTVLTACPGTSRL